jgi:hypothetical protein
VFIYINMKETLHIAQFLFLITANSPYSGLLESRMVPVSP